MKEELPDRIFIFAMGLGMLTVGLATLFVGANDLSFGPIILGTTCIIVAVVKWRS